MFRPTPTTAAAALPLSHIIAPDAPLLSPLAAAEQLLEPGAAAAAAAALFAADPSFTYEPFGAGFGFDAPALKLRASPDGAPTPDEACVPTAQLFGDLTPVECGSPAPEDDGPTRPATPVSLDAPSRVPARKPHRVSTKDFVPPDVTGLSKREARLVKNRAAAFLSRQRKREEFELMEVRVAELEQENAMLRGATHALPAAAPAGAGAGQPEELLSEIEQLRAQLAAAERQTAALSAQLQVAAAAAPPAVKAEPVDVAMPSGAASPAQPRSRSSSVTSQKPERSGASLGLMVLLCALPTLLSMPTQSALPARLTMPSSALASRPTHTPSHSLAAFDPLQFLPAETDFSGLMDMDMDLDSFGAERDMFFSLPAPAPAPSASPTASLFGDEHHAEPATRTLEFADGEKLGLGGLDISFDAVPAHDGKIRVRIHPNAAASSASSPAFSRGASPFPAMPGAYSPEPDAHLGPWLGVADERPFDSRASFGSSVDGFDARASFGALDALDFGRASPAPAPRRRVRIALKSVPQPGGEGGEWEVELC